jgi:replicative DNA helicase
MNPQVGIERPLPSSHETERAILGAILVESAAAGPVIDRLAVDDFDHTGHRQIFAAARFLSEAGKPTDLLAIFDELQRTAKIEAAGGIAYVAQLGDSVPRGQNLDYHARTLKTLTARRALARAAFGLYEAAFDAAESSEQLLDSGIEKLSEIARGLEADRDCGTTYRDAASALLGEFDSGEGVRIFSDVDDLDRLTGGFRAGELVIFTAETGVGKTLLAQQTRRRSCRDGRHTLFCSGEMRAQHLISRELATEADVEHWKMRRPETDHSGGAERSY